MTIRNDCIVLVAMLLTLAVASSARRITATEANIENPFGGKGVETSSKLGTYGPSKKSLNLVATYSPAKGSAAVPGLKYLVTCVGDGAGGDSSNRNPCKRGNGKYVTVTMVAACNKDCRADIQLSTDAYDSIVDVEDSDIISIDFTPAYDGP